MILLVILTLTFENISVEKECCPCICNLHRNVVSCWMFDSQLARDSRLQKPLPSSVLLISTFLSQLNIGF